MLGVWFASTCTCICYTCIILIGISCACWAPPPPPNNNVVGPPQVSGEAGGVFAMTNTERQRLEELMAEEDEPQV